MDEDMLKTRTPSTPPPIAHTNETSADGGGYSFVFHGRPPTGEREEEEPPRPIDRGPAVQLEISPEVLEKSRRLLEAQNGEGKGGEADSDGAAAPESAEKPADSRNRMPKHWRIRV